MFRRRLRALADKIGIPQFSQDPSIEDALRNRVGKRDPVENCPLHRLDLAEVGIGGRGGDKRLAVVGSDPDQAAPLPVGVGLPGVRNPDNSLLPDHFRPHPIGEDKGAVELGNNPGWKFQPSGGQDIDPGLPRPPDTGDSFRDFSRHRQGEVYRVATDIEQDPAPQFW